MMTVNLELIREYLEYSPTTGIFRWSKQSAPRGKAGAIAGCKCKDGYIRIRIKNKLYSAHRLAYAFVYGDSRMQIDHINRIRDDNRIENLREVTPVQNNMNRSRSQKTSSGKIGVAYYKLYDNYVAYINFDNKRLTLGYGSLDQAIRLRKDAEIKYYGKEMDN